MKTRYFVLDGESSAQYGIAMQGPPVLDSPKPKMNRVSVPGRNGDLVFYEDAFENVEATLNCYILKEQSYYTLADANIWLAKTGYRKFSFDGDDESYRLAVITNIAQCAVRMFYLDPFELKLSCKPQKFLNTGDIELTFTASSSFDCPAFSGLPLLRIYGTSGTVTINDYTITLNGINDYVDVDCELQDAYKGMINCNSQISCMNFPKLKYGENNIILSSGISKVIMTPRWFVL